MRKRIFEATTACEGSAILRNRAFQIPDILPYLEELQAASGHDLSSLVSVARSSLVFQSGGDHVRSRGAIARFFRESSLSAWQAHFDASIAACLDRLASSDTPDLVRDFSDPLFVSIVGILMAIDVPDEAGFLRLVNDARQITEPLLPLRRILALRDSFAAVMAMIPAAEDLPPPPADAPLSLPQVLALQASELPAQVDAKALIATLAVACHTLAESLSFSLWGLLQAGRETWRAMADPSLVDVEFDRLLQRYASTLALYRTAGEDASICGRAVQDGQLVALDMPKIRQSVAPGEPSLSFGAGAHRCPGAALSRLIMRRAIPALASRFPRLRLERDGVRFHRTRIIQAPIALPCEGARDSSCRFGRGWEVKEPLAARSIISDDEAFAPPTMISHLTALQAATGHDLSVALLFARNAQFFMSGPRHIAARRAVGDCLGANRLAPWIPHITQTIDRTLDTIASHEKVDMVADFGLQLLRGICQPLFGIEPSDSERFDRSAAVLQTVLKPLLPMRELLRVQAVLADLLELIRPRDGRCSASPGTPLLDHLLRAPPPDFTAEDCLGLTLVLYGASFNLHYTLVNAIHYILALPPQLREGSDNPQWISKNLESRILPAAASPKFIYRIARRPHDIAGMAFAAGETARIPLADVNAEEANRHLAFGHGLHHCLGASLSRLVLKIALPALFGRFPELHLANQVPDYEINSQTVAPRSLICLLSADPHPRTSR